MKKIILYSLAVLLLAFGIWGYKLVWGKPFNIDHFFDRYLIGAVIAEPEILTLLGAVDNTILDFHSHKLTDASPQHTYKGLERNRNYLETLNSYNRERLSGQKAITYDMVEWLLESNAEGERWAFHDFPVNQTFGIQSRLPDFMTTNHQIIDKKSAENYIKRLLAFESKFDQVRESVNYRAERGVIPPRFVIDHVLREMNEFMNQPAEENPLYKNFETALAGLDDISEDKKSRLLLDALSAINNEVKTGYGFLIETFEQLQPLAGDDVGAWSLPDGEEYYRYLTRMHTTLPLTPEEIHQTGLKEVERIKAEMFALFDEIGISGETVGVRFALLDEDPDMFYSDTTGVHDQIIADYMEQITFLYEKTAPLFKRTPKAEVEVRRVPEYSQETAPFAYYNIPAMDGSRPGIFFINLRDINEISKYGMMTLSAHEAVPGHHFQLALAQEIEGVPIIRQIYPFTAYVEGWALYTEWLLDEIGVYENDPYGNLGRLQAEMFRAARLVVDTGIHMQRWTRDVAIDYMYENTGMPMGEVVSEIERYIVMPGQALAYKVGMLHIQNLRTEAESKLGDSFDVAEFHDMILMNGSLPLEVLTGVAESWIAENSN
ncbi:MAG: DUF885 domain-containing protein [Bacteroidetes bacterium]|nr:DUF885 domain-containing protein [Bacteroidota bacterium]